MKRGSLLIILLMLWPASLFAECYGLYPPFYNRCDSADEAMDAAQAIVALNGSKHVCGMGVEWQDNQNTFNNPPILGHAQTFAWAGSNISGVVNCPGTKVYNGYWGITAYLPSDYDPTDRGEICCDGKDNNGDAQVDEGCDLCQCHPQHCPKTCGDESQL